MGDDLKLIAAEFLDDNMIPKDRLWLLKYFKNESQRRFLSYYLDFHHLRDDYSPGYFYANFVSHTGIYGTSRVLQKWAKKLRDLLSMAESASSNFDLEALELLKSGRFRFSHARKKAKNSDNSRKP